MLDLSETHEFRPKLLARRSEGLTWILAIVVLATWWILQSNQAQFATTAIVLFIFLIFGAAGMSLGNWMDRRTVFRLDAVGVNFENGLRKVRLGWEEIEKLRVLPSQSGSRRVQVLGSKSHFEFRTLAVLKLNEKIRGQSGFAEGDRILETILNAAQLSEQDRNASYTYYARD